MHFPLSIVQTTSWWGINLAVSLGKACTGLNRQKMDNFSVSSQQCRDKNLHSYYDDLLFVTGKDIRYFFFAAFLLGPGRI